MQRSGWSRAWTRGYAVPQPPHHDAAGVGHKLGERQVGLGGLQLCAAVGAGTRALPGAVPGVPIRAQKPAIPGGYLRGTMSWRTVRLIMRIAETAAAATIAGRGPFFSMPSRTRARLARQLRLALSLLTGSIKGSMHHQHAARAPPHAARASPGAARVPPHEWSHLMSWSLPQEQPARRPLAWPVPLRLQYR